MQRFIRNKARTLLFGIGFCCVNEKLFINFFSAISFAITYAKLDHLFSNINDNRRGHTLVFSRF